MTFLVNTAIFVYETVVLKVFSVFRFHVVASKGNLDCLNTILIHGVDIIATDAAGMPHQMFKCNLQKFSAQFSLWFRIKLSWRVDLLPFFSVPCGWQNKTNILNCMVYFRQAISA